MPVAKRRMRILVACEFSGTVRDAFLRRGHDAWSCDLIPNHSERHIRGDVTPLLREQWDLVIAHPPCTYLTVAANKWHTNNPQREVMRQHAFAFFLKCYNANSPRVCVENPIGVVSTLFDKPDQVIQPWQFGHRERKGTCLWLLGLPKLVSTKIVEPEEPISVSKSGKKSYSMSWLPASSVRHHLRSITFQGIADAMAEQWG